MRSLQTQRGFTLIEIIVVVVILGLIAAIALSRFIDIKDDANDSVIAAVKGALQTGFKFAEAKWVLAGSPPGNAVDIVIDGVTVRFRQGHVHSIRTTNIAPPGTPNRNRQSTRLWYYFLQPNPGNIDNASMETGWFMLGNNCAGTRTRCWEYRVKGTRYGRIVYTIDTGSMVLTP